MSETPVSRRTATLALLASPAALVSPGYSGPADPMTGSDFQNYWKDLLESGREDLEKHGGAPGADAATALELADTAAASNGGHILVREKGVYGCSQSLTIAQPIQFLNGAILKPSNGVTVRIAGPLLAGMWQCFDESDGGRILLESSAAQRVIPHWWGAGHDWADSSPGFKGMVATMASSGTTGFIPAGLYKVDAAALSGLGNEMTLLGAGMRRSLITPIGAHGVINLTSAVHSLHLEGFGVYARGAGHGISIELPANSPPSYSVTLRSIRIVGIDGPDDQHTGKGLYMNLEFSTTLDAIHVELRPTSDNGIELQGSVCTTLRNCYVSRVGTGRAGYVIYEGNPVLLGCNGLDEHENSNTDWAVFGTGVLYCRAILIGCNVEDFRNRGLVFRAGSYASVFATHFLAKSANVIAMEFQYVTDERGVIDDTCIFVTSGAGTWKYNEAVHADGCPLFQLGSPLASFWNPVAGSSQTLPYLSTELASPGVHSLKFHRPVLDQPLLSRFDGASGPARPPAGVQGRLIFSDFHGQPLYDDGVHWRRVSDGGIA